MENTFTLNHPIIDHKMTLLRDKRTGTKEVRELVSEISIELIFEALKDAKLEEVEIETPLAKTKGKRLNEQNYAFTPILRAGMGMLDGLVKVMPNAKVGHIGLYRNENLEPIQYYFKVPKELEKREVIVLEPILATGGSAVAAIQMLKEAGAKKIKFLSIVSAIDGIEAINEKHPDVQIYTASVDGRVNEKGYILPGLGDAGDRIFGTK